MAGLLYAGIAALVWRLSKGWIREDFLLTAAVLWPLTLLAWLFAGVLLLQTLLLAVAGYLNTWWDERRPRRLSPPYFL